MSRENINNNKEGGEMNTIQKIEVDNMEPDQIDMMNEHELRGGLRKLIARSSCTADSIVGLLVSALEAFCERDKVYMGSEVNGTLQCSCSCCIRARDVIEKANSRATGRRAGK